MPPASSSPGRDQGCALRCCIAGRIGVGPGGAGLGRPKRANAQTTRFATPSIFLRTLMHALLIENMNPSLPPCGLLLRALSRPQPLPQMCAPRVVRLVSAWLLFSICRRSGRARRSGRRCVRLCSVLLGCCWLFWGGGFLHFLRLRLRVWVGSALLCSLCRRSSPGFAGPKRNGQKKEA